ncbi:hypothetical protein RJT34_28844 [Clitoria ternatea]|uniref:rRNA adenine N(6)-methyltransferase n=1 Tax=Clitoria ternatea TaxID=43366 RepID=A0AAN9FEI4_CLITE
MESCSIILKVRSEGRIVWCEGRPGVCVFSVLFKRSRQYHTWQRLTAARNCVRRWRTTANVECSLRGKKQQSFYEAQTITMPLSKLLTLEADSLENLLARKLFGFLRWGFSSNRGWVVDGHYILNSDINEQLAGAAAIEQGDVVLKIGSGTGSLTNVLLNSGAFVLAVEKDKHMAALVSERFSSTGKLKVLTEDIVKCHVRSHMSSLVGSIKEIDQETRKDKVRTPLPKLVVANIPFNISTDVIKLLLSMGDIFSEVVLLLQVKMQYIIVQCYVKLSFTIKDHKLSYDPEYKFKVPRTNFFPQHNVDPAVVSFKLKIPSEYPQVSSSKSFFSMVNSVFNEKRKMLRKSLQHICTSLETEEALKSIGLLATSNLFIAATTILDLHRFTGVQSVAVGGGEGVFGGGGRRRGGEDREVAMGVVEGRVDLEVVESCFAMKVAC